MENTPKKSKKLLKRDDYESFVEKFKPKKTTDDCYTPAPVYEVVKEYVLKNLLPPGNWKIERPFYPGGDYQKASEQYDENTVVIDNPPFSILSKILRFYEEHQIKFFLFAPHLTVLSTIRRTERTGLILTRSDIIYHNGAHIKTDFVTNMLHSDDLIRIDPELRESIILAHVIQKKAQGKTKPANKYPKEVQSVSSLSRLLSYGKRISIPRKKLKMISALDCGYKLFGSGFLVSQDIAELAAEAKIRDAEAKIRAAEAKSNTFELSPREKAIVAELDK